MSSSSWMLVQPEIAKFANCISYDRAGFGWSDSRPDAFTSLDDIEDLHVLLKKLNMPKPYILVGHSYGGMLNRLYADRYPEDLAGIVLVDAYHEEQLNLIPLPSRRTMLVFRVMNVLGLFRLFIQWLFPLPQSLPKEMRGRIQAEISSYSWVIAVGNVFANVQESLRPFKNLSILDKPLTVISAGLHLGLELKFKEKIMELQKDLVRKSTRGKQMIAEKSGHNVPFMQPEIIVESVKEVF